MTVEPLRPEAGGGSVSLRVGSEAYRVNFVVRGADVVVGRADPLVPLALLPAMKAGGPLRLPGPASPRQVQATARIQEVFQGWDAALSPVEVDAGAPMVAPSAGTGLACLFSGGVDSSHAALTRRHELTSLVFVHGFDLGVRPDLRSRIASTIREAAIGVGVPLVEVETDLRRFSGRYVSWRQYHGSAMATVALLLSPPVRTVCLASSLSDGLIAYGSHPDVDPLWSTEATQLVHAGAEVTRFDKIRFLVEEGSALRWLRVCQANPPDGINCGRCEKCLRTMVSLRALGALDRCPTFPPLDLDRLARLTVYKPLHRSFWGGSLAEVEAMGADPELAGAIRTAMGRPVRRRALSIAWRLRTGRRRRRLERGGDA